MKIANDYMVTPAGAVGSGGAAAAGDFAAAMAQARAARQAAEESTANSQEKQPPTEAERIAAAREARAALRQELVDFLEKPLEVHLREAVMKEMGITEEDLAAMTPTDRLAAESMIAQKVRERLLERKDDGERAATGETTLQAGSEAIAAPAVEFTADRLAEIMTNSMAMVSRKA